MHWPTELRKFSPKPAPAHRRNRPPVYSWNCCWAGRGRNSEETPDIRGLDPGQDFWFLNLTTRKTKLLARLAHGTSTSFDITPDGKQIVFDRIAENSDIVLIDFPN